MKRLQKYMSECGIASRRKSEELITSGKVKVNDKIITELGFKVQGNEKIEVLDNIIKPEEKQYYLLYKPQRVVTTTSDEKGRKNVIDLINSTTKLFPVGRLDYNTSGVLLITNDGELGNKLTHPSSNIEKEYYVKLDKIVDIKHIKELENGIILDGKKTKKSKIKIRKIDKFKNRTYLNITITEGRNHQVKNMFKHFNYEVLKLKRIRYAFLTLEDLKEGEYRRLNPKEVKSLYLL